MFYFSYILVYYSSNNFNISIFQYFNISIFQYFNISIFQYFIYLFIYLMKNMKTKFVQNDFNDIFNHSPKMFYFKNNFYFLLFWYNIIEMNSWKIDLRYQNKASENHDENLKMTIINNVVIK
jgi:hypothetical protein